MSRKASFGPGPWARTLARNLPAARTRADPKSVHQVRVAVARLRVYLRLAHVRALTDDLRWLRRGLAGVRDLDVQLALGPPLPWARVLEQRRERAGREAKAFLRKDRVKDLLVAVSLLEPVEKARAKSQLRDLARHALVRGKMDDRAFRDFPRVHGLRRSVRSLRFALEWLDRDARDASAARALERLQGALGDLCDRWIAVNALGKRKDRAVVAYRRALQGAVPADVRRARDAWHEAKPVIAALAKC